jgi:hypothetical protein
MDRESWDAWRVALLGLDRNPGSGRLARAAPDGARADDDHEQTEDDGTDFFDIAEVSLSK